MQAALTTVQEKLGYSFADESWLRAALTHPSKERGDKKVSEYERLEFLGDRVLSLLMVEWLFTTYANEKEGALAKRHAGLVNRDILAAVAGELGLDAALRFVSQEDLQRGRVNILSDALEALIGALYCDAGNSLVPLRPIVKKLWQPYLNAARAVPQDPKSAVQEWAQARQLPLPDYSVVAQHGPAHAPHYVVALRVKDQQMVQAEGTSKREAEKKAAELFLKTLQEP